MRVHLLGTAAGGAFPQWNCNCRNCGWARTVHGRVAARTQSCIAVSTDLSRWFLVNASPDIRIQLESFPPLWPPPGFVRGTAIAGVLLTNADLDHTLGLFNLRESGPLVVHATSAVRRTLVQGINIDAVLSSYHGIEWREPPGILAPLRYPDGSASGIQYSAFAVSGRPPRYQSSATASADHVVGYRFVDDANGGRLVVIPDLAAFDDSVASEASNSDVLLLDGTFFDEDEMRRAGAGTATATEMGHLPVGGSQGSLGRIAPMIHVKRVYVHINNTNPMLLEDSPERAAVEAVGVKIGFDGMQFSLQENR
jgi:pyrroloquinoline quinone biosynthesis protein B